MAFKIGVDMERMRNVNSGLGQYCLQLADALVKERGTEFHFYYPHQYTLPLHQNAYNISRTAKVLGISAPQIEVFHATHQDSKLFARGKPYVLTIHDLNFIEKYPKNSFRYHQFLFMIQRRVKRAAAINFISNYTFTIAQKYLDFSSVKKTAIIHNGFCLSATHTQTPAIAPESFLFTIGIINPKKNFHVLLPIAKATGLPLIIAGNTSHPYVSYIKKYAEDLGITHLIHFPGLITEEEKLWYYRNCKAFLFPSLAEGFGMPVIEAMSQGAPVFLSRKTSLPEVGGPLAYFFDTFDPADMVTVFEKGMSDFNSRTGQADLLKAHAAQFSWEKAAKEYIHLYQSAL